MCKICILAIYLIILSVYDFKEKQVPVVALYLGGAVILLLTVSGLLTGNIVWRQLFGLIPGAFLLLMAAVTRKVGVADGVVLLFIGAILGYQRSMLLFGISLMLFSGISIILLFLHKVKGCTRLPYLPFLTVAFIIQQII